MIKLLCLSEDFTQSYILSVIRPAIKRFVLEAKYVKTVDGLLERLGTLVFYIREIALDLRLNYVEIFKLVLSCDEVKEVLNPFAIHVNGIEGKILGDPRHKSLRPHLDILIDALKTLPMSKIEEKEIHMPSIQQSEQHESVPYAFIEEPVVTLQEEEQRDEVEKRYDEYSPNLRRRTKEVPVKIVKTRNKSYILRKTVIAIFVVLILFGVSHYTYNKLFLEKELSWYGSRPLTTLSTSSTQFITDRVSREEESTTTQSTTRHSDTKITTPLTTHTPFVQHSTVISHKFDTETMYQTHTQFNTHTLNQQTNPTSTSSPTSVPRHYISKRGIVFGNTSLVINGSHLIVKYHGRWLPYLELEANKTIYLVPYPVVDDHVIAEYTFVNSTYSVSIFSLSEISQLIGNKPYETSIKIYIDSPDTSKVCYLAYNGTEFRFIECKSVIYIKLHSLFSSMSVHEAILSYINSTSMSYLRQHLLNDSGNWDPVDLSWYILSWLDENTKYDYQSYLLSMLSIGVGVRDPILFFNLRRGVCRDYALFTATALLAGGVKEAYILIFNTDQGFHATAAIEINDTFYILDQKLPVYEWADYVKYVFRITGNKMQVIRVWLDAKNFSAIEMFTIDPMEFSLKRPDTYPLDRVPEDLVADAIHYIGRTRQISITPTCRGFYSITWEILSSRLFKAYTPLFHKYFIELLANTIAKGVNQYLVRASCLWYSIENDKLILYVG